MKKFLQIVSLTFCMFNVSSVLAQPNFNWAKNFGSSTGEVPQSITADASGNVYSTGYFQGSADLDPSTGFYAANSAGAYDFYVSKLDVNGNFVWGRSFGSTANDIGQGIVIDANLNVYVAGYFTGTVDFDPGAGTFTMTAAGSTDIFILKLDASGNFVWAKQIGAANNEEAQAIAIDNAGNIYTTGYFDTSVDFDPGAGTFSLTTAGSIDIFISKLDANGNFVWAKQLGGTGGDRGYGITVDANQNVYTTGNFFMNGDFDPGPGTFNLTIPGNGCFISKLDMNGDLVWAKAFSGTSSTGRSIKVDNAGNVYTTGYFQANVDFDPGAGTFTMVPNGQSDIFISKLDVTGSFVWANQMGGIGYDYGYSLALDASQNIYTTGSFNNIVDFDPGAATYTLSSSGVEDVFINKLDLSGNFVWAYKVGSINYDIGNAIAIDPSYNIFTTGYFSNTPAADLDPTTGTFTTSCAGSGDIFILKLSQCAAPSAPANTTPTLNLLICQGNTTTLTASGSGTISWYASPSSTTALGSGTSFVTPTLTAGTYTYYNEAETCTLSASRTAIVFTVSACTGVSKTLLQTNVNLYPNPVSNILYVSVDDHNLLHVKICNAMGQVILEKNMKDQDPELDLSFMKIGIYFVELETEAGLITKKLIKD